MSLGFGFSLPAATWNGGSALSSDPSLYMDYTVGSSGVPGVQPGYYLVDDVSGNLTQTTFSSLITFSRASNATRYSPTGQLEYAPHNLLLQSQDFATTWTVAGTNATITANTTTAPDGTTTADSLTDDATSGIHRVAQAVTTVNTNQTVFSCFVKYSTMQWITLSVSTSAGAWAGAKFDVQNGVLGSISQQGASWTANSSAITPVGNGWYRCVLVYTPGASGSTVAALSGATDGTTFATSQRGSQIYAGTGSVVFIWGAQLAVGPNPLDYTPTTTAVVYGPRFDYDPSTLVAQGLLIEEQRTNSIRNNTMVGAVAGTPGTLPTNWQVSVAAGLTTNVIGTGTSGGVTYIDLQITGTSNATSYILGFDTTTQIAASAGQTWAWASWVAFVSGSLSNVTTVSADFRESNSGGTQLAAGAVALSTLTSSLVRQSATRTLSEATTAFVQPRLRLTITNGAAIDITLRIGLPQLEQGAFATSVIPTTTAATTRSADIASIGTLSPWYNATEGTLFAEWSSVGSLSDSRIVYALSDGTFNNVNYLTAATAAAANQSVNTIRSSNTAQATIAVPGAYTNYTDRKTAAVYKVNDFAISGDGSAVAVDTSGLLPVGVDRLALGTSWIATSNFLSGYLRRITYTPRRLTNAELQSLTS